MRSTRVASSVVVVLAGAFLVFSGKSLAIDPATAELSLAFTQADKIKVDPKPVKVDLYAIPEDVQDFAVLKMNGEDGKNYVATNPTLVGFQGGDVGYRLINDGLKVGALPYGDRKYSIQTLPNELTGLPMLNTKMAHKGIADARFAIGLSCDKPCYVFVALDERAIETFKKIGAPAWLQEYSPTDWRIETDDPVMSDNKAGYIVFGRKVPAGRILLGAPAMDTNLNAMYFAFFAEAK
jgi:hypothetical protein